MTWRGRAVALLTAVASLAGCSGGWCDFCAVATMRVAGSVVVQGGPARQGPAPRGAAPPHRGPDRKVSGGGQGGGDGGR